MKADVSYKVYKSMGIDISSQFLVNKNVKAVIINFGDERGDIIVENDNFGTRRKYPDFTNGKKKAGLHPLQIVFTDLKFAALSHDRYIGADDQIHTFGEGNDILDGE